MMNPSHFADQENNISSPDSKDAFRYTYSAKAQEEIRYIRSKYIPKEESSLERLRRLDAGATNKAVACSVSLGVAGTLIFGTGMSLCLVSSMYLPGVIVGIIGLLVLAPAYPLYLRVLRRERERIAPQILQLTDELMK